MKPLWALPLALLCTWATAQNPAALQQGKDFAKSLTPQDATQLVNPAGVNSGAWGGNTAVPSQVPPKLGHFSTPSTDASSFQQAQALGLTGLGQTALERCASYQPTGDPAQDQECAAVNFMAQRCLTPNDAQQAVLRNTGTSQIVAGNCLGIYGQGQQHFEYANRIDKLDPAFAVTRGAQANPTPAADQTCTLKTVVTEPARNVVKQCASYHSVTQARCSQILSASVVTSQAKPSAVSYDCPIPLGNGPGIWASMSFADMTMANYLRYPPSTCYYFIRGDINSNGYLQALGSQFNIRAINWNQDYGRFELAATARANPSCQDGSAPVEGLCTYRALQTSWEDGCTSLEASAGIQLGPP